MPCSRRHTTNQIVAFASAISTVCEAYVLVTYTFEVLRPIHGSAVPNPSPPPSSLTCARSRKIKYICAFDNGPSYLRANRVAALSPAALSRSTQTALHVPGTASALLTQCLRVCCARRGLHDVFKPSLIQEQGTDRRYIVRYQDPEQKCVLYSYCNEFPRYRFPGQGWETAWCVTCHSSEQDRCGGWTRTADALR